ncbi:MAG: GAF domain-containing protein [Pyrinomonadaceae bacterium]
MNRNSNDEALLKLKAAFANGGVRGAVAFLNSLTHHRFTSLYRFDGPTLRNITFFDRENPTVDSCEDIPVEASYCVFVRDTSARFTVRDAGRDERVKNHPKRDVVQSYCGVPLLDRNGKMFGSICHFDFKPGPVSDLDVELLEYMARLLQQEF